MKTVILALAMVAAATFSAAATEYTIVIDKMKFGPPPARLHPGDTIVWQNNDILRHSATARDKSFDFDIPAKASATMTVGVAGTVSFYCKFHPGMTGTLVVSP